MEMKTSVFGSSACVVAANIEASLPAVQQSFALFLSLFLSLCGQLGLLFNLALITKPVTLSFR